ncbi:MAG: MarR family transcriptional regulator [Acidobacteria bacterium]|nr:MarR family transcriptional regulator [Acidobacteriota bacterium]MBI3656486.1 MarR family transcriptional regulator [Acidobacteriota bacterium]
MAGKLRDEIKQQKAFRSAEEEAFLNLLRTADTLMQGIATVLKPAKLSPAQYNALRILRGAGAGGLGCRAIAERMITRDPDITRLLDRLESRKLVTRSRGRIDRRVVTTRVTAAGLRLLGRLDAAVDQVHKAQLGHMDDNQLVAIIDLLEKARQKKM